MKANLKKILSLAALGMTLLATTVPTWAGMKNTSEVSVITSQLNYYVRGSMAGARYSADDQQRIECVAIASTNPFSPIVQCSATDSAGNYATCVSTDPKLQEVVQSMTDSSSIYFEVERAKGNCKYLQIYNSSELLK